MAAGSEALRRAWEHDSAGREAEAVVEYRQAFEAGIDDEDLPGALLLQPFAQLVPELLVAHRCARDAHDRELQGQPPLRGEVVEGGDELAGGKVSGSAEDHHDPGLGHTREPLFVT